MGSEYQKTDDSHNQDSWKDFHRIDMQENVFKQIFEYSIIPTIVHDMEMNVINVNRSAANAFGYSVEEFVQLKVFDLHSVDEIEHSKEVLNQMQKEEKVSVETIFQRKDGSTFFAEATPCKYILDGKPIIHVFIQDITERKEYKIKLKNYNEALEKEILMVKKHAKKLEEKNEELAQFAFIASHDLQEPLRTISSFTKLLEEKYTGQLDENANTFIKFIVEASKRMSNLITGLLEYGQIGRKGELTEVNCNEILNNIKTDLSCLIEDTKATIEVADLPVIKGYPTEIHNLFQNLISNSIKFRRKNVKPVVKISANSEIDGYLFSVKDNGIGIEEQYQDKIFTMYHRLHNKRDYEGSGIGLSHCRKIIQLHDGDIWVKSSANKGSTFYFKIPKL